jgi:hypothetical protein
MWQGRSNACTVCSVIYGLKIQYHLHGKVLDLDPLEVHKKILLEYYDNYDPYKSVSYKRVFRWLKENNYIWMTRKIQDTPEDYKIKIFQGYPVYCTIHRKTLLHAVCVFQYDKDTFIYHDSSVRWGPLKVLEDFEDIAESYVIIASIPRRWGRLFPPGSSVSDKMPYLFS